MAARIALLLDEDSEFADLLALVVSDYGLDVRQASSWNEVAADLRRLMPAVILIAVDLPEKIGFEVFSEIKAMGVAAPIVLTTSTLRDSELSMHEKLRIHADGYLDKRELRRTDRFVQFALAASQEAIQDAALSITDANAPRVGVYIGTAFGGLASLETVHEQLLAKGPNRVSPLFAAIVLGNLASGQVSIRSGASGPNNSSVAACAAGAHSIGEASYLISRGSADVMIAGGTEAVITPLAVSAFGNMRALSTRNATPQEASRPFDHNRDGFVMAEGAGILILEELQHARRRGARIYAEIVGYGSSGDAYHLTAPCPDGAGAARCMQNALHDAGLSAEAIDLRANLTVLSG